MIQNGPREPVAFDFHAIQMDFKSHCRDYQEQILIDTKSQALAFAYKLLYTVQPLSRYFRATGEYKLWTFFFNFQDERHTVIVTSCNDLNYKYKNDAYMMTMSMKQASLVAMDTFNKFCEMAVHFQQQMIFSPAAGAIFPRDEFEKLITIYKMDQSKVISTLNASCQPGGEHLPNSDFATALVVVFVLTRNRNDDQSRRFADRTVKQYLRARKEFKEDRMERLACCATGEYSRMFLDEFRNFMNLISTIFTENSNEMTVEYKVEFRTFH